MRNCKNRGFTLIEAVVGIGIAGILIVGVIGVFSALARVNKVNRQQTVVTNLAAKDLEVVRNLPYDNIGTLNGNPPGNLPDLANADSFLLEGTVYGIYYEITYADDPADGTILLGTDPAPNDYKQVNMFITNNDTGRVFSFVTSISPAGLEGMANAGALAIKVFDSEGQPVQGASIHIENTALNPDIILDRQSNAAGDWVEVALPASVNGYEITVTKAGYSTDQTYSITAENPNPVKPHATIVNGTVTQVSFEIDLLSTLNIYTLDSLCQGLSGVDVNVAGAKLIGANPDVLKYDQDHTSGAGGLINLAALEWDTYTPGLIDGQNLMIYGTSPIGGSVNLLPGTTQNFSLIMGTETTNSLLVIVKDAGGAPLEGASVHLQKGGSEPQDYYGTTGGSVWVQRDWTGGDGQVNFADETMYLADDGNVDVNSAPTGVRLKKITGDYVPSGELYSSTFDTGTSATVYSTITWQPTSQDPETALQFQIATNNDNATWVYKGPDGTGASYYSVPGTSVSGAHDNQRYIRYRALLSTTDDKKTPVLTTAQIDYVSGCFTPGQVIFPDLTAGNNYDLDVSLAGYTTQIINNIDIFGHAVFEVVLTP